MRETRRTTCNRDCPDACSLLVSVEAGQATGIRGDPDDPVTHGFLCERTARFLHRQYAKDRFTSPMLRRGGKLVPIGWDEALDLAANKLMEFRAGSGPASILHYRSGGSLGILKVVADRVLEEFGPVTLKHGDICSGAGEAAQTMDFGLSDSNDLFDLRNSKLIVVWGKNPHVSGVHLLPLLQEARRRGIPLLGIDPVQTRMHGMCDLFLTPRPGTDAAIALAMIRTLYEAGAVDPEAESYCDHAEEVRAMSMQRNLAGWAEVAGVPAGPLREAAELYASRRPANIQIGWGMTRRRNGAATVRAIDALAALAGNLGVPGGGASYYYARRSAFELGFLRGLAAAPRSLPEALLGASILEARDPPIRMIWVTAGNPVSMLPDAGRVREAFSSRDFVVVVDTHPTDTTDCADLVLPTLTLLEDSDVLGAYGNHFLRVSEPAIEPPPGPRHEWEIWRDLAARIGLDGCLGETIDAAKELVLQRVASKGASLTDLRRGPVRNPEAAEIAFAGRRFETENGRAQLFRSAPGFPGVDSEFPLTLLATSTSQAQSSQWSVRIAPGPPELRIHPQAAGNLADGEEAWLESRSGRLRVQIRHDSRIRIDIACMPKGGMLRDHRCANLLIRAEETDQGNGAAYYDEPVRLVPVGDHS